MVSIVAAKTVRCIVDDERIDGVWSWDGRERWDFRRRLV